MKKIGVFCSSYENIDKAFFDDAFGVSNSAIKFRHSEFLLSSTHSDSVLINFHIGDFVG